MLSFHFSSDSHTGSTVQTDDASSVKLQSDASDNSNNDDGGGNNNSSLVQKNKELKEMNEGLVLLLVMMKREMGDMLASIRAHLEASLSSSSSSSSSSEASDRSELEKIEKRIQAIETGIISGLQEVETGRKRDKETEQGKTLIESSGDGARDSEEEEGPPQQQPPSTSKKVARPTSKLPPTPSQPCGSTSSSSSTSAAPVSPTPAGPQTAKVSTVQQLRLQFQNLQVKQAPLPPSRPPVDEQRRRRVGTFVSMYAPFTSSVSQIYGGSRSTQQTSPRDDVKTSGIVHPHGYKKELTGSTIVLNYLVILHRAAFRIRIRVV